MRQDAAKTKPGVPKWSWLPHCHGFISKWLHVKLFWKCDWSCMWCVAWCVQAKEPFNCCMLGFKNMLYVESIYRCTPQNLRTVLYRGTSHERVCTCICMKNKKYLCWNDDCKGPYSCLACLACPAARRVETSTRWKWWFLDGEWLGLLDLMGSTYRVYIYSGYLGGFN